MGMISNQDAFLTGHNIGYCAVYFDQVLLAAKLSNTAAPDAQQHAQQMIASLQRVGGNFAQRLQLINTVAKMANLSERDLPTVPPEFYPWANHRHLEFLEFWPASNVAGCLFVIGHSIGEIRNGLIISNLTLDFETHLSVSGRRQRAAVPDRLRSALTRWDQAVQILAALNEPLPWLKLLQQLHQGLNAQLQTSMAIINLEGDAARRSIPLHHKILQILGHAELEITENLHPTDGSV